MGGGAEGNRTPDLVIANDALSRLSYGPTLRRHLDVAASTVKQACKINCRRPDRTLKEIACFLATVCSASQAPGKERTPEKFLSPHTLSMRLTGGQYL